MREKLTRDYAVRLAPFVERGLIREVPTEWQLLCGQVEMAPYVVLPDAGDDDRYGGARFGHPLARTPIVLSQIGWEHFRVGHGLHSTPRTLFLHLAYVFHEGMPTFDLQLVQTVPDGLERFRALLTDIDEGRTEEGRHHQRLSGWVIPNASEYRRWFLEPGGFIDRAAAFDYPADVAEFLRPEFTSLTSFCNYCLDAFKPAPRPWFPTGTAHNAAMLGRLFRRRFNEREIR